MDEEPVERIPLKLLFGAAERTSPLISPDGRYLAHLRGHGGVYNIWAGPRDNLKAAKQLTGLKAGGVYDFRWTQDSRTLVFRPQGGGDENYQLWAVDAETGKQRPLTPARGASGHTPQALLGYHLNRNTSPLRPEVVLAAITLRNPQVYDLYEINVRTGELKLLEEGDDKLRYWLADDDLVVRTVLRSTDEGGLVLSYRSAASSKFREVWQCGSEDAQLSKPLAITPTGCILMRDTTGRNTAAMFELDPESGTQRELASDDTYDVSGIELDPAIGEVEAVRIERERIGWNVLDQAASKDYETLAQAAGNGQFGIISRTADNLLWTVWIERNSGPYECFLYNRRTLTLSLLFKPYGNLADYGLAARKPVVFDARDGLELNGYLTLPRQFKRPGPMVLLAHGGPWARDSGYFSSEAQWLANRGYACLEVNFRGSTGFGKAHVNAGNREWGGKMLDDLVDGVNWAAEQGVADPKRVAVMGQSFGGYSALAGVALTPDVFAGAVSLCGFSNLLTELANEPAHWRSQRGNYQRRVGKLPRYEHGERRGQPKDEKDWTEVERAEVEFLRSRSPIFHADKACCPVLLAHGRNDPRCPVNETESFAEALRRNGVPVELIINEDEGHFLAREDNRLDFYSHAEQFFAGVLVGRSRNH